MTPDERMMRAALFDDAELAMLLRFCDEQIVAQNERRRDASQTITVYTGAYAASTIGPDRDEAAMRGEYANNFWRMGRILRALRKQAP